uniref:non-specific serine/threonine protein kinase n=1 Tax=Mucochytrium quahogii TaxID=96639 RepID=A0A7S2WEB9_9STRA|mmetsp:Transcript_28949/g.46691  ORF Transcript_28949/g.46691 Transcript_28949/m.46691 type:complete len:1179 (+) Transcript_28949:174-3710(+)
MSQHGRNISEKYTLGDELGKGGFATVFACRNSETGETLAVKRISLRNLNKDSLMNIEQEVSLLKKLDHPNIVKYIDTVRTGENLFIVLEYMENGSLAQNLRLFGTLSQSLCALYIRQILNGLSYLHEQGVIHRDIKGANILTTKQGLVKLADFGVATHSSATSNEVVGTPYWMAPEIIEMSGPTTACDIWSVGCTIIELLTIKPPYFDIPPMAALYRIVQDDHPPLPEGLSPALREFLLLCFRKEPLLRSSAKDLLRHRWVLKTRGVHEPKFVTENGTEQDEDDVKLIEPGPLQRQLSDGRRSVKSNGGLRTRSSLDDENVYSIRKPAEAISIDQDVPSAEVSEKQRTLWRKSVMNTIRLSEAQRAAGLRAQRELDQKERLRKERGDDDDENSVEKSSDEDDLDFEDFDDVETPDPRKEIQQQFRAMVGSRPSEDAKEKLVQAPLSVGEFDLDDLDGAFGGDDTGPLENLDDLQAGNSNIENTKLESKLARFRESESRDDDGFMELGLDSDIKQESNMMDALKSRIIKIQRTVTDATNDSISNNVNGEDMGDDTFLDGFDDDDEHDFEEDASRSIVARQTIQVEKLINLLRPDQDDETVLNACSKLTTLFREQPAQRRTLLTHHGVIPIMEMLEMSSKDVLHAVLKVVGQIIENDREFQELLSLAGLIPIVAKFCRPSVSRPIRLQAASLVKQFLKTSVVTLQMLVACGGLPVLAELLIPCEHEGENNTKPDVALAYVAVDGMKEVFQSSSITSGRGTIPKNDFCRLFAKEGVLVRLVSLLEYCRSRKGESECAMLGIEASALIADICDVLLLFSLGDSVVKKHFAGPMVLEGILRTLALEGPCQSSNKVLSHNSAKPIPEVVGQVKSRDATIEQQLGPLVKTLLKCVKNLSMETSVLEALESSGAIPTLVPFLSYCSNMSKLSGTGTGKSLKLRGAQEQLVKEVQNLVMLAMFYLCRLSKSRQEQAAISGIIPFLMDAIATRSPVKTFALQILTDFAYTSEVTRDQLWRCGALDFFLDLLVSGDVFWQERAFISVGAWLSNATPEVERALLRPRSLQCLVSLFQSAQSNNFENYVKELLGMLNHSHKLSEAIGRSGLFMTELVARLSFPKTEVRINLLKMLKTVGEHHQDLEYLILEHNLFAVVTSLAKQAEDAHRVLIVEIAHQLLDEWKTSLDLF